MRINPILLLFLFVLRTTAQEDEVTDSVKIDSPVVEVTFNPPDDTPNTDPATMNNPSTPPVNDPSTPSNPSVNDPSNPVVDVSFGTPDPSVPRPAVRRCRQSLGVIQAETVRNIGRQLLSKHMSGTPLEKSMEIIFRPIQYDLQVVMLCASCRDHDRWYWELGGKKFPGYHAKYCGSNTTYYNSAHSSLVFLPLDPATNEPFSGVKLRTFFTMAGTPTKPGQVPTEEFPVENLHLYNNLDTRFLTTYLPGLVGASSGSIALFPDPAGTATSRNTVPRTVFHLSNYERVTAISYLALQKYVLESSLGCTKVDDKVVMYGNDDGAYGITYATQVLQRFNIDSLTTFVQAGPLNLEKLLVNVVKNEVAASSSILHEWMQLAGYTFSSNLPGIANTNSDQPLFNEQWSAAVQEAFGKDGDGVVPNPPGNPITYLHNNMRSILNLDEKSPCSTRPFNKACQAILQASAYPVLLGNTDRLWAFPVHFCYSEKDEVVDIQQLYDPEFFLDDNLQSLWKNYTHPAGFDALFVSEASNHRETLELCSIEPLLFYTLQGHLPTALEDRANYRPRLTAEELSNAACDAVSTLPPVNPSDPTPTNGSPTPPGASPTDPVPGPSPSSNPPAGEPTPSQGNPTGGSNGSEGNGSSSVFTTASRTTMAALVLIAAVNA